MDRIDKIPVAEAARAERIEDEGDAFIAELPGHGGAWDFQIQQEYEQMAVKATGGGHDQVVRGSRLRGEEIRLVITGVIGGKPWNQAFRGRVKGDRIEGTVAISNGEDSRTLPWQATRTRTR